MMQSAFPLSIILRLILLILFIGISGCTTPDALESANISSPNTEEKQEAPRIALVMKTLTNPFFVEMEKGARRAESELGIELIVKTTATETSIEQQIEIVEQLIRDEVDAIVIAPGDSVNLIPVLKKAQDAGIIIINIDNRLDAAISEEIGLVDVPFISVDNELGAYLSAKYVSDQITSPAEALILEGIRTAENAEDRKNGAIRAFEENPNITIVAMETAHWKIDEGYAVTEDLLSKHPEATVIFCSNDMMALGTIQYLQETGRTDILVAAYDALNEAKEAILADTLQVTIDQQAAEQGYLGVVYAMRALSGESLPLESLIDVFVITSESLK